MLIAYKTCKNLWRFRKTPCKTVGGAYANYFHFRLRDVMRDVTDHTPRDVT